MRLFEFFREPENPLMGTPRDTVYPWGKVKNKKTGRIFEISGTYSGIFGNIVKK